MAQPDPRALHAFGFDYMHYDKEYFMAHGALLQDSYAVVVDELADTASDTGQISDYRRLIDIHGCK